MPELPEVETVVRGLNSALAGAGIRSARLTSPDLYRRGSRRVAWIRAGRVVSVERIGKAILVRLSAGTVPLERALVVHLGMTGKLYLPGATGGSGDDPLLERAARKHLHGVFRLDDGRELWYVDPRRFGYIHVGPLQNVRQELGIGLDPFEMRSPELRRRLRGRKGPIKSLLLNQAIISGVGNIYADEILFRAGIHPLTAGARAALRAADLLRIARQVLRGAIRHRGTTLRDYRDAEGAPGRFQFKLGVYGRDGDDCRRCGSTIQKSTVAGRGTHYCATCQPRA